ncbi:MAG: CapA family protein [Acidimicrobiales bacterium]
MTVRSVLTGTLVVAVMVGLVVATSDAPGAQPPSCFGTPATMVVEAGQVALGTSGDDVIVGTGGPDVIGGRGGDDLICGLGGGDHLYGGPGADQVDGGAGPDEIWGGGSDDLLIGGAGGDTIYGAAGSDTIVGNEGGDSLFGGQGADRLVGGFGADTIVGNQQADLLQGGRGRDTLRGGVGPDTLAGGASHDSLRGQRGNDILMGGRGPDACEGGPGADAESECESTTTLAFSGEVLSHGPVIAQAAANGNGEFTHDYRPMFASVKPLLEYAELAMCHLETPVSEDNVGLSGYPIFNAPRDLPAALAAVGYDACSTASNHSIDKGAAGVRSTLRVMAEAGVRQTGMARSQRQRDRPALFELGDLTIGHLSYTYGLNGFSLPVDQPYLVNVTTPDRVLEDAEAAKAAGADIVVLSIQWGNEYQVEPSTTQVAQARRFLRSDVIDVIVGAHVHVVQPLDVINGKYVFYGIGNFLSNQSFACCPAASQNGVIAYLDVLGSQDTGWIVDEVSFVPTRVDRSDYTIVPLPQALDGQLSAGTRALYRSVIADTTEVLRRRGVDIGIRVFD